MAIFKTEGLPLLKSATILLMGVVASPAATINYDLGTSWSDASNPNGVWSYRAGDMVLPHVNSWEKGTGAFESQQPAWAAGEGPGNDLPAIFKSSTTPRFFVDWKPGDVVLHSTDEINGQGDGSANIVWTSPLDGKVDILGAVWMGRDIGRGNQWRLYIRNTLVSSGDVFSGDVYSRESPYRLSTGFGGTNAVTDVAVAAGDAIRLEVVKTSSSGDFVVVRFTVRLTVSQHILGVNMYAGVRLEGNVGREYRLEYVESLAGVNSWTALTNITLPESPYLFLDLSSTNSKKRFYRAIEMPSNGANSE